MTTARHPRARYRTILRFAARYIAQEWWFAVVLPRLGLGAIAHRGRAARIRGIAVHFHAVALDLGGLMIKVGQFMSSRLDVLPPEITSELEGLQDEVPAVEFEQIRELAEAELGVPLSRAYSFFDPMPLAAAQAVRTREWRFKRHQGHWSINNQFWDPARMDAAPGQGDVEIWTFDNRSGGWFHPIHVHLTDFKILDRNGQPPQPYEVGPKDVAYAGEGEVVRVIAKFGPRRGKYMMHCHNVIHEDHDMMTNFEVGTGGPDPVTTAPPKPVTDPLPPLVRPPSTA